MSLNKSLLALSCSLCWFASLFAERELPNIVLILTDDVGLGDIGMHHREYKGTEPLAPTPVLDQLAQEGLWLTDAHSPNALCSPTRYAVMSGNYTYRSSSPWGVWGSFRESPLLKGRATLGSLLQSKGYTTAFLGKWHLGGDFYVTGTEMIYRGDDTSESLLPIDATRWVDRGPQNYGFDYDFTLPCGVQGPFYTVYENGDWYPLADDSELIHYDATTAKDPIFISDKGPGIGDSEWDTVAINQILAEKAVDFIEANKGAKPFFMYYCTPAVHLPHTPPESLDGEAIAGTSPSKHLDMNRVMDWEVGQIINALKATEAYENTLIIFTSDNGGLWDPVAGKAGHFSNGGYRGSKNLCYEGGHRVPLIAVWPDVIEAGRRSDALVNGTDLFATFAELTGATFASNEAMDSYSFLDLLKGNSDFKGRETVLLQSGTATEAIYREGNWKLIIDTDYGYPKWDPIALFNLEDNRAELESGNLINDPDSQETLAAMFARFKAIRFNEARSVPLPEHLR